MADSAPEDIVAAHEALRCGDLAELLEAVQAPLTFDRARRNVALAWRLSALRFAAGPLEARAELCLVGPGG